MPVDATRIGIHDGVAQVTCWCEANIVAIPAEDLGRTTAACSPGCRPGAPPQHRKRGPKPRTRAAS